MALRALVLAILLLLVAAVSKADREDMGVSNFRIRASASVFLASFDGELQTPSGRVKGTTSPNRPTTSEIGLEGIDFRYRLRSSAATGSVDRAYVIYAGYFGFQLQGPIYDRLRGEIDFFANAGINNVTSIDSDMRLVYLIADNDYFAASLLVGLRGIWLRYKDDQKEEQNEIDVRTGAYSTKPWAGAHLGLRLSY